MLVRACRAHCNGVRGSPTLRREIAFECWARTLWRPRSLPEGIYGTDCRHLPDEARYAVLLGIIASQFDAAKIRAIGACRFCARFLRTLDALLRTLKPRC